MLESNNEGSIEAKALGTLRKFELMRINIQMGINIKMACRCAKFAKILVGKGSYKKVECTIIVTMMVSVSHAPG